MDNAEWIPDAGHQRRISHFKTIEKLFPPGSSHGCAEKPTALGFFALCTQGSSVWNEWRDQYPEVEVDMSNTIFPGSGFIFKDLDFGGKLKKQTSFENAEFGNCSFLGCSFEKVDFTKSKFNGNTNFSDCIFNGKASFKSTKANKKFKFKNNTAHAEVNFTRSTFSERS